MQIHHPYLIEKLGGPTAVARRLGIKAPSVLGWIEGGRDGIPEGRLLELGYDIDLATDHEVRRWHLRPDDWWRIWPELIGTHGAPKVPQAALQQA